MKLIKNIPAIPARTKEYRVTWMKREFLRMTPRYLEIRATIGGGLDTCFSCDLKIPQGEMMALAGFENHGNEVLCQMCADVIETNSKR